MTGVAPSDRQRAVLRLLVERIEATGAAPSVREIAEATGLRFASPYQSVDSLARKGYVRRVSGVPHGLAVVRGERDRGEG